MAKALTASAIRASILFLSIIMMLIFPFPILLLVYCKNIEYGVIQLANAIMIYIISCVKNVLFVM